MSTEQIDYFEGLDIGDDGIEDGITENELRDQAKLYLENSLLSGEELNELKNKLWDLLQEWDIDSEKLRIGYEQSIVDIQSETKQGLIESNFGEYCDYFGNTDELKKIQEKVEESGITITPLLRDYKTFIENNLKLPDGSSMSSSDYETMIGNIKTLIIGSLVRGSSKIEEYKEDNGGKLEGLQLAINQDLMGEMSDINNSLFPSALFYLKMNNRENIEEFEGNEMYNKGRGWRSHVKGRLMDFRNQLVSKKLELGDEVPSGLIYNNNIFQTLDNQDTFRRDDSLMSYDFVDGSNIGDGTKELNQLSLLNEKDKVIEERINKGIMGCCLLSIVPLVGEGMDLANIYSNEGEFVGLLRKAGIIPERYTLPKRTLDTIITVIGLLASTLTLGIVGRAQKTARLGRMLNKMGGNMEDAVEGLKLLIKGLGEKGRDIAKSVGEYLPDLFPGFSKQEQALAGRGDINKLNFDSMDNIFKLIDEIYEGITPPKELVEAIAGLNDGDRVKVAEKLLGRELNGAEKTRIFNSHNVGLNRKGARVFEYNSGEIYQKGKRLMENGEGQFSREEAEKLLDYGIAGLFDFGKDKVVPLNLGRFDVYDSPADFAIKVLKQREIVSVDRLRELETLEISKIDEKLKYINDMFSFFENPRILLKNEITSDNRWRDIYNKLIESKTSIDSPYFQEFFSSYKKYLLDYQEKLQQSKAIKEQKKVVGIHRYENATHFKEKALNPIIEINVSTKEKIKSLNLEDFDQLFQKTENAEHNLSLFNDKLNNIYPNEITRNQGWREKYQELLNSGVQIDSPYYKEFFSSYRKYLQNYHAELTREYVKRPIIGKLRKSFTESLNGKSFLEVQTLQGEINSQIGILKNIRNFPSTPPFELPIELQRCYKYAMESNDMTLLNDIWKDVISLFKHKHEQIDKKLFELSKLKDVARGLELDIKTLGLDPKERPSLDELKKQVRKLQMKYHPDRIGDLPKEKIDEATKFIARINVAWGRISQDPSLLQRFYDQL